MPDNLLNYYPHPAKKWERKILGKWHVEKGVAKVYAWSVLVLWLTPCICFPDSSALTTIFQIKYDCNGGWGLCCWGDLVSSHTSWLIVSKRVLKDRCEELRPWNYEPCTYSDPLACVVSSLHYLILVLCPIDGEWCQFSSSISDYHCSRPLFLYFLFFFLYMEVEDVNEKRNL